MLIWYFSMSSKNKLNKKPSVDIAVVDISKPTNNVMWEIWQCYNYLLPQRIIFLADLFILQTGLNIENYLAKISQRSVFTSRKQSFKSVLIYYDVKSINGQFQLGETLIQVMKNIISRSF